MIHHFPKSAVFEDPPAFTDPFRYVPHPLVKLAAAEVMERIDSTPSLSEAFSEGKMLGVLVCRNDNETVYITAFSGNVSGRSLMPGFVPPIFDLTVPDGHFKMEEMRISRLNDRIAALTCSEEMKNRRKKLAECHGAVEKELQLIRSAMRKSKQQRDEARRHCNDPALLLELTKQSQFEKAEFKRYKTSQSDRLAVLQAELEQAENEIEDLRRQRAAMSDRLQEWIFRQYVVHNFAGEESSIADLFAAEGLIPPGGTGECAAPKLLEYAFRNGLTPLAMGEFWYGKDSSTAVRVHGHFYPSCTSKCGPLLKFMLKGMPANDNRNEPAVPAIVFEDDAIIVVEKPCGMPSVPGLDGRCSLLEWMQARQSGVLAVHRLDMDTSGIMVFAKTSEAAAELRRQFEEHAIRKTYLARLSSCPEKILPGTCPEGVIDLPLAPDYDERPRQKVDRIQGKPAVTEYRFTKRNIDGTTDIVFHPITGRTHQLRVHAAHSLGLGCPIVGDLLYGGLEHQRLCLHSLEIIFRHPVSGKEIQFAGKALAY